MSLVRRLKTRQKRKDVLAVLFVSVLFLSIGTVVALNPPTYSTTEVVEEFQYDSSITHYSDSAVDSQLFSEGERLENADSYFYQNHQYLQIEHTILSDDSAVDSYETQVDSTVVIQSTRTSETVVEQSFPVLHYEDRVIVNLESFREYENELSQELPRDSAVELRIEFTGELPTDTFGVVTVTDSVTIQSESDETYSVVTQESSDQLTETREVQQTEESQTITVGGVQLSISGIIIVGIGIVAGIVSGYLEYLRRFTDETVEQLRYEYEYGKYDSWITTGNPYQDPSLNSDARRIVKVSSLEGLVNIAIDNNTRVIHSEGLGRFYVYGNQVIYAYTAPDADKNAFFIESEEELSLND